MVRLGEASERGQHARLAAVGGNLTKAATAAIERGDTRVRITVDLPQGSFQKLVLLEARINAERQRGVPKLQHGPLLRGLLGSWMQRVNGGA